MECIGSAWRLTRVLVVPLLAALIACASNPARTLSPQAVVAAKFAAVNRHALEEVVAFYAPESELTASDFCEPRRGRADVRRTYASLFAAYPDIAVDVHEYFTSGERVAVRLTVRSSAQGRAFAVPVANYFTVRDGLISSDDGVFDTRGRPCSP